MANKFKPCAVDECNGDAQKGSRGWCSKHYQRFKKSGDPLFSKIDRENSGKPCEVESCNRIRSSSGFCTMHYQRFKSHGDPEGFSSKYMHVRKWIEVHKDYIGDDCLKWPFHTNDKGRGTVGVNGVTTSAPRAMCIAAHGNPPTPDHQSAHSCGKGHDGCMNPRHLRWATAKENEADKILHGTLRKGEDINTCKLTAAKVREIRRRKGYRNGAELGREFGVSTVVISNIMLRRSWAWLD